MAAAVVLTRSEGSADDKCLRHRGSEHKLKRGRHRNVTWPVDENLCEVCHFCVDDAPSLLGVARQGVLLGKQQSPPFARNVLVNEEFSDSHRYHSNEAKRTRFTSVAKCSSVPEVELGASSVVAVPWHPPVKFILDESWMWAGGDESTEVALQQQRERSLFEAFYPRLSSVPDSPAEQLHCCKPGTDNDALLPEIPLIPLEEEEAEDIELENMNETNMTDNYLPEGKKMAYPFMHGTDVLTHFDGIHSTPTAESVKFNHSHLMSEADSSIAAVAAAACMVVKSLGESDLVDEKLLLEILKNPALLESLTWPGQATKKNKSQVIYNDTARGISLEPITSLLGKFLPDHGATLNASPVSVLAKWEEGAIAGSPGPIACGIASIQKPVVANLNSTSTNATVVCLPSETSHETRIGGDILQKISIRAVPEKCMNIPFESPNVQDSSLSHAYKPKDKVRLSCQKVLRNDLPSASSSMQTIPAATPSVGSSSALSTSPSNSEMQWRTPALRDVPLGRLVQDAESKRFQPRKTVHNAPPNMGGRAKRFCMYFNSPRGCRNGGSCAFVHQSLDSELNTMTL